MAQGWVLRIGVLPDQANGRWNKCLHMRRTVTECPKPVSDAWQQTDAEPAKPLGMLPLDRAARHSACLKVGKLLDHT